ncbi:MAG: GGDEF domain-containing protein [Candidatus Nanopelagicales bacterium]
MNEVFFRELVDNLLEGVYFVDRDRRITYWNSGAELLTGYGMDEVVGHSCSEGILRHVTDEGQQLCLHGCPLAATITDGDPREAKVYMHHKNGHRVPVTVRARPIRDDAEQIVGSAEVFTARSGGVFSDLEGERRTDQSYRDPVSGIGNRLYAEQHLAASLGSLDSEDSRMGLLFLDVDHFKTVNDNYGHNIGDKVLRMVARTLANGLRPGDLPCRWGGEEFIAILPETQEDGTARVAERIRMLVENSWLPRDDQQIRVTVSIGATVGHRGESADEVIERADRLMYASKQNGRNQVHTDSGPLHRVAEPVLLGNSIPWATPSE